MDSTALRKFGRITIEMTVYDKYWGQIKPNQKYVHRWDGHFEDITPCLKQTICWNVTFRSCEELKEYEKFKKQIS